MNYDEWNTSLDVELLVRHASCLVPMGEMRRFTIDCARRVIHLTSTPLANKLLEVADRRAAGEVANDDLELLRAESIQVYDSLYPGHGAPSPAALAYTAVGESVFTDSALDGAMNGSGAAAHAVAGAAAASSPERDYDGVYEKAFKVERLAQAKLLKERLSPFLQW